MSEEDPKQAQDSSESPQPEVSSKDEEFRSLLERSLQAREFEMGESVRGLVVAIRKDVAFVDIGGKSEATIDVEELKDADGKLEVAAGDHIAATVVSTADGVQLSMKLARGAAAHAHIEDAYQARLPVEGRVERTNKGGYEVRIGGQRAFCPFSQIDVVRSEEPETHVGKIYEFRISELKAGGKKIVVSRRALLKEEEKRKAEETRKSIVPGVDMPGKVVSVREYGAFVDIGGIQGLLHVSEMSWGRLSKPSEIVKPGDEITVKVLRVDEKKGRISLGLKQLQADPWSTVAEKYAAGQIVPGTFMRVQEFGAFVEIEPGIEALAHVSTFPPTGTPDGWKKTAVKGKSGSFEVLTVDPERKRIGIAMVEPGSAREQTGEGDSAEAAGAAGAPAASTRPIIASGAKLKGKVERHESYGVFIFLAPGRTGLMPAAESGIPRGVDLKKKLPVGSDVEVMVLEVDESGRRIRLSRKALRQADEKSDARDYSARSGRKASTGQGDPKEAFGSIGDKLRAALEGRKKT